MPTFTAIALDRLLEPRAQNSISRPRLQEPDMQSSSPEKKSRRTYVSPALYTTPEATPLPDSPISFPPSPYIVNHKRRGPRLKSFSRNDVVECQQVNEEVKVDEKGVNGNAKVTNSVSDASSTVMPSSSCEEVHFNGYNNMKPEDKILGDGLDAIDNTTKSLPADLDKDCEIDDFFDPQDVMSVSSNTEVDDNTVTEHSWKPFSSPFAEYFDACEGTLYIAIAL